MLLHASQYFYQSSFLSTDFLVVEGARSALCFCNQLQMASTWLGLLASRKFMNLRTSGAETQTVATKKVEKLPVKDVPLRMGDEVSFHSIDGKGFLWSEGYEHFSYASVSNNTVLKVS